MTLVSRSRSHASNVMIALARLLEIVVGSSPGHWPKNADTADFGPLD
jgi:hypothetical protein